MTGYLFVGKVKIRLWRPFDPNRKRISMGNRKTGFPSINKLAGNKAHAYDGAKFPEIIKYFSNVFGWNPCGTCPCDCDGCYAKKITRYANAFFMYCMNTYECMKDARLFWSLVDREIDRCRKAIKRRGDIIRIDDSGDIIDITETLAIMDCARIHIDIVFYGYSECYAYVDMLNTVENINFRKSHYNRFDKKDGSTGCAYVDDGNDPIIAKMKHCPAVDRNGKKTGITCNHCKLCPLTKSNICFTKHR